MRRRNGESRAARRRQRRTLTLSADGPPGDVEDVATLIRAVVHARLLGMRLLTLDARVVVATDIDTRRDGLAAPDRLTLVAPDPDAVPVERDRRTTGTPSHASTATRDGREKAGDVTTARELLAQGADTLARAESAIRAGRG